MIYESRLELGRPLPDCPRPLVKPAVLRLLWSGHVVTVLDRPLKIKRFTLVEQVSRLEQDIGGPLLERAARGRSMAENLHGASYRLSLTSASR